MFSSNCFGNLVVIFHYKSHNSVLRRSHRSGGKRRQSVQTISPFCFVFFFLVKNSNNKKDPKIFKIFSRWLNRMECGQYSKQDTKLQTNLWIARSGFLGTGRWGCNQQQLKYVHTFWMRASKPFETFAGAEEYPCRSALLCPGSNIHRSRPPQRLHPQPNIYMHRPTDQPTDRPPSTWRRLL